MPLTRRRFRKTAALAAAGWMLLASPASAAEAGVSGLPLPRFVSLGAGEVNVRTGPGPRYPISWVFQRRGLPVEIIAEFEHYRKIRDSDGAEGWVHKNMLSGKRSALVTGALRALLKAPDPAAPTIAYAEPGVQGRLITCGESWCELELGGKRGYALKTWFYGVYPGERIE